MSDIYKATELLNSDITPYQIAKETGIPQSTLSRLKNKETDINKALAGNVATLARYYDAMVLNIGLQSLGIPTVDSNSEMAENLKKFNADFLDFGEEMYFELQEDEDEFAEPFKVMFEDALRDDVTRSRMMLAWIKDNFGDQQ